MPHRPTGRGCRGNTWPDRRTVQRLSQVVHMESSDFTINKNQRDKETGFEGDCSASMKVMCGKGTLPWRPRASLGGCGRNTAHGERVQLIEESSKKEGIHKFAMSMHSMQKWLKYVEISFNIIQPPFRL